MADDAPLDSGTAEALDLARSLVTCMLGDEDDSAFMLLLYSADPPLLRNALATTAGMVTGMVTSIAGQNGEDPSKKWSEMIAQGVIGPTT